MVPIYNTNPRFYNPRYMNNESLKQVKSIYGEILGIADHLPISSVGVTIVALYHSAVDRLNEVSGENFNRFKVSPNEGISANGRLHSASVVRPKMTSLLSTLEYTYGLHKTQRGEASQAPTIVTINNNNSVNISVTPLQQILEQISDNDSLRTDVEELKSVIEGNKDKQRASGLLNSIQQKSWDIFIALLPAVLQGLGSLPPQQQ